MFSLPERERPLGCLVRDNDGKFTHAFDTVFNTEGIGVIQTPIRAPKERLQGTSLEKLPGLQAGEQLERQEVALLARSAAAHQATDRRHQLGCALLLKLIVSFQDAGPGVSVEQAEGDLVQGSLDGADLGENVDAVTVILDHALDAADLSLDAGEALEQLVLARLVALTRGCTRCRSHTASIPLPGRGMLAVWMC